MIKMKSFSARSIKNESPWLAEMLGFVSGLWKVLCYIILCFCFFSCCGRPKSFPDSPRSESESKTLELECYAFIRKHQNTMRNSTKLNHKNEEVICATLHQNASNSYTASFI